MKKNTKLGLAVIGVGAVAYYLYTKNKPDTKKSYAGNVGNRLGANGLVDRFKKAWKSNKYLPQYGVAATSVRFDSKKGFASSAYVNKGDVYNNNLRFGTGWIGNKKSMTGAPTFFTNQSEKVNY
jgi:hypothetical protein